jgi:hypothetical protein
MVRKGFPVPRITEGFVDRIIESLGGRRPTFEERGCEKGPNADYFLPGAVAELKIFEEEPLEKAERQTRLAKHFADRYSLPEEVRLNFENLSEEAKEDFRRLVGGPIQNAVKKAAAQIKATKTRLGLESHFGVLIAVNNGFCSLPHDEFDKMVARFAKKDTSQISFTLTTTVEHHKGSFDTYVFCKSDGVSIHGQCCNPYSDPWAKAMGDQFTKRMGDMIADQMGWSERDDEVLLPVSDILFERDGVLFIRKAPPVPDLRFQDRDV